MNTGFPERAVYRALLGDVGGTNARFAPPTDRMVRDLARPAFFGYGGSTAALNGYPAQFTAPTEHNQIHE